MIKISLDLIPFRIKNDIYYFTREEMDDVGHRAEKKRTSKTQIIKSIIREQENEKAVEIFNRGGTQEVHPDIQGRIISKHTGDFIRSGRVGRINTPTRVIRNGTNN